MGATNLSEDHGYLQESARAVSSRFRGWILAWAAVVLHSEMLAPAVSTKIADGGQRRAWPQTATRMGRKPTRIFQENCPYTQIFSFTNPSTIPRKETPRRLMYVTLCSGLTPHGIVSIIPWPGRYITAA